ncbi:helix-turn-helix domain-containing protein [Priestia megaterium]|uniref:Replication protein n=1 Tax=Priestia megaterium TaxID=1404 RepID=A0A6M6DJC1_PRIMG|nr:helix-turn-helix domain-containing protein [Priestia megaterium]QJX74731.1 hypothetical protein FDZ14_00495 [Priestia megaterium]
MSTVKQFHIRDAEHFISVFTPFRVTKSIAILNIKRYGLEDDMDYILTELGHNTGTDKVKVSERVQEQAELFQYIFDTKRDCYVRIRNKETGSYYTYNVDALKNPHKLQNILERNKLFRSNVDIMYSLNTYNNMHSADNKSIFSIHLIAIDVDFDKKQWSMDSCLAALEYEFSKNTVPTPNIIERGHRIRLLYKVECVGATQKSKNLVKKVTEKIADKLKEYGASPQPITTYGRIGGSVNSKDGSIIEIKVIDKEPYMLRDLQNEVLEPPKYLDRAKNSNGATEIRNDYSLNMARIQIDLPKLQTIRDEGYREVLCFAYRNTCKLLNMSDEEAKDAMLAFNKNFDVPLKANKVEQDTRNVNRKQYLLTNEWFVKVLDLSPDEEIALGCKTIMSETEKSRRKRKYNKKHHSDNKEERNEKKREQYRKKNPVSVKDKKAILRQKIRDLVLEGLTQQSIAETLQVSLRTIKTRYKELKQEGLL